MRESRSETTGRKKGGGPFEKMSVHPIQNRGTCRRWRNYQGKGGKRKRKNSEGRIRKSITRGVGDVGDKRHRILLVHLGKIK